MLTIVLRSLRSHRGRLSLTAVAVSLAVGFVTAGFVLSDSLRATFGDLSNDIVGETHAAVVAGEGDFDRVSSGDRFDASVAELIATVDGVATISPELESENILFALDTDGEAMRRQGPPTLSFSVDVASPTSPFTLVDGATPGPGEIALDVSQAEALGVEIGDEVTVSTPDGTRTFTLAGLITFGDVTSGIVPYFLVFDVDDHRTMLGVGDLLTTVSLQFVDDADASEVIADLEAVLPDDVLVVDQVELLASQTSEFGQIIDMIQLGLLGFASITLFVSTFVIANTFAVLVSSERRRLGTLRAVGATPAQATTVVTAEAALVGLVASAIGLAVGVGMAEGIKYLFESVADGGFPEGPILIEVRTVIAATTVGVGVSVLSALIPAVRAGRVSPLVALGPDAPAEHSTGRVGRAMGTIVGATIGRLGAAGRLAADGVSRSPRRVATTSASMIVGLAVIAAVSVIGASYGSTIEDLTATAYDGDLVVTGEDVGVPFSAIETVADLDEVTAASAYSLTEVRLPTFADDSSDGGIVEVVGFQPDIAEQVVPLIAVDDALAALTPGSVYITDAFAASHGLAVGDPLAVEFGDGALAELTVADVIAETNALDAGVLVDASLVVDHANNTDAAFAIVRLADGVDLAAGTDAVAGALAAQPQLVVADLAEHVEAQQAQAQQLMTLANGLLALTIVVALAGIANTMALTVIERRRELGLLRAVGMSRYQLGSMVRLEAFTLSSIGAAAGIGLGVAIALAAAPFLPETLVASVTIPTTSLAIYGALAIGFGVLASLAPARRAARLDILDAIAIE